MYKGERRALSARGNLDCKPTMIDPDPMANGKDKRDRTSVLLAY
jgi:hypothetical protein